MTKELKIQVPDSLHSVLSSKAESRGVSIEALCLYLLDSENRLIEPSLYGSLVRAQIREEMDKVLNSDLPKTEIKKRVRQLEAQIMRYIR